jgi:hypothetical protein
MKTISYTIIGFMVSALMPVVEAAVIYSAVYNSHIYHLLDRTDTWQEAENEAISLGGHLVTVNNAQENEWILNTFQQPALDDLQNDLGYIWGLPSLWTGYVRDNGTYEWYWVSGETSTYTNWTGAEPRNSWNEVTSGILLINSKDGFVAGEWHDIWDPRAPHDHDYGLAETVVPIPSTLLLMCTGLIGLARAGRFFK